MSRSSVTKQSAFQAAPEVIPILDGSCARLKRLLKLCDQQIESIERNTVMSGPAKGKELQILVRMVLNLQKDLLKYSKALHPDLPVKQPTQTGGKLKKEDLEALSDSQLHELMDYFTRDDADTDVDIQEIVDTMLDKPSLTRNLTAKKASLREEASNKAVPKEKTGSLKLKVQPRQHEIRQTEIKQPVQGNTRHGAAQDRTTGKHDNHSISQQKTPHDTKQPDNRKPDKPPPGSAQDPNTE